jgi:hypothetical protein
LVYTLAPYWAHGSSVGSALGQHQIAPPHSCWPPTDCTQKRAQQQTACSHRTLTKKILIKQSSARSLHDCPQLELSSQAGLCHQNTNNQAFSTVLISTNWSIASNAQLSSRPLDFVMMHLMHKSGITTIASCCRDMFMYRTYLNRNNDTETMGEAQDQLQGHNFNQSSAHI